MDQEALTYKNILDNMTDGVMTVDRDGLVTTFNPAAARLLGLDCDEVVGRLFAEVFISMRSMDDFNQTMLDAVYDVAVGFQRVVEVGLGEQARTLTLVTSYLQVEHEGEVQKAGVIAVFSDITEVKELRETELRLADAVKKQHAELQDAYLKVEENNRTLATALKKVQMLRVAATVIVIGLFAAIGAYSWNADILPAASDLLATASETQDPSARRTVAVAPRMISSSISLTGRLEPLRTVDVASPISGKVAAVHFTYGERVAKGQRLIDLDVAATRKEYRSAQISHITALKRFNEIRDWASNAEVMNARRSVRRAERELEIRKRQVEQTTFLLERGVIPASEHETAERALRDQQLEIRTSRESLQDALAKGGPDARRVARLELDNAAARLHEIEETLKRTAVHSPVDGVVLQAPSDRNKTAMDAGKVAKGRSVSEGEYLLSIGDLEGLSVRGRVDEVDIVKIRRDQLVRITGDAFPGIRLRGKIVHVSSQADSGLQGRRGGPPSFEVTAAVRGLTGEQRERLRVGMSADLQIVTHENPNALMVPIQAVRLRDGEPSVLVMDRETGDLRKVSVVPGVTTVTAVEIVAGLEPGDEVVLPPGT